MKKFIILALFIASFNIFALSEQEAVNFFKTNKNKNENYTFNKYEGLISGFTAFVIGNIGYLSSDNSVLKLTYSGIQTIGIINIGRGVYDLNNSSLDKRFEELVTNKNVKSYSKSEVALNLIEIYAYEQRAKRLALFYSSSILSLQYFLNAVVFDSPGQLKNTYIFLGGVNTIIAFYSGFYKGSYESTYFGNGFDLNPFLAQIDNLPVVGLGLSFNF